MAKGNLFLGQARGKVGSVVFARAFGEQITRTRPTSVANPKTIGQNTQRAILATIAKEAALLTPIVDHSFANVTYGAASVRHFRKLNMGILRNMLLSSVGVNYNLSAKGAGAVSNALKISEGNLPAFSSSYQSDVVSFYQAGPLVNISEISVDSFKQAYPFIQGGDQLTVVKMVKTSGSLVDGDATFALKVDRIVFAPNAFDDPNALALLDDTTINPDLLDLTKTTNVECLVGVEGGGGKGIGCLTNEDNTYAAALILSRKVNNAWQRSTQYLELCNYDDTTDNDAAIASYGASESLSVATEYLNQADESTPSSGVKGSYLNATFRIGSSDPTATTVNAGDTTNRSIQEAANTLVQIGVNAFEGSGSTRKPFITLYKDNEQMKVGSGSIFYPLTVSATTAGAWKLEAVFADGSKAIVDIPVSVQA